MPTREIMREFRDKAAELADAARMPEVKARLKKLAADYDRELEKLGAPSIVPK